MKTKLMLVSAFAAASLFAVTAQAQNNLKLVWQDEFDGNALNTSVWNVEDANLGYNNELQYYRPGNVQVKDGNLVITPKKESYGPRSFTSGRINSQKKFFFTHGRIDARIKMPKTDGGLWPAFWMLGEKGNWPDNGEIDIVELGKVPNENNPEGFFPATVHWQDANGAHQMKYENRNGYSVEDGQYHLYTCVWDENSIKMYLDLDKNPNEAPYYTLTKGTDIANDLYSPRFDRPFHILFNVAVGGDFPNILDPNGITVFNRNEDHAMYVDYVRVYQEEGKENINKDPTLLPSAPTPTQSADNVTSLYSDAYKNVGVGSTWQTWQAPDAAENFYDYTTSKGDIAKGVNNINYGALNLMGDWSTIDVTNRDYLHVDIYSFDNNSIQVGLTSKGYVDDGSDNRTGWIKESLVPGWNSFDIPFTDMKKAAPNIEYNRIVQFSWQGGTGYSTLMFDNIYVYKANTTGINKIVLKDKTSSDWYTIDGKKLNGAPKTKGLYITEGRKIALR